MRRRDHAHVDGNRLRRAHRPDLGLLKHAQELHLQRHRHVADLVEEDRPAVRGLEQSLVRLHRARERAARMAEELGLEQRLRNGAAIHRDERPLAAPARAVDGACEKLLAGAGFPVDQHARVGIGDQARLAQQVLHPRASGDDSGAPFAGRIGALLGQIAGDVQRGGDLLQQLLTVERLRQESEDPALRRGNRVRYRAVRGENDHRKRGMLAVDRLEELQAVDPRHPEVGDDDAGSRDRQRAERRFAAVCGAHAVTHRSEPQADQFEEVGIVIDQKDVAGCVGHDRRSASLRLHHRPRRLRHRRSNRRLRRLRRRRAHGPEAGRAPSYAAPRAS